MPRVVTVTVYIQDSDVHGAVLTTPVDKDLIVHGWDREDSAAAQLVANALENAGMTEINIWNVSSK